MAPSRFGYPIVLGLISAALFGAAVPLGKVLLQSFPPLQLAGLLYLGAALGVLPATWKRGGHLPPSRDTGRSLPYLAGAIALGGMLGPVLLLLGLRLAPAASVSLWLTLELVATAAIGALWFHDHLDRRGWLGFAGVVAGSIVLAADEGTAGFAAGALVVSACICWGFDNHLTALIDGFSPLQTTFWKGFVAGSFNLILALFLGSHTTWSPAAVAFALLAGAVTYGASIALYIAAAQGLGAVRGHALFSTAPFFGVALAALMLEEPISAFQAAAALLFAVSIALVLRHRHAHVHEHTGVAHIHPHRHDDGHHSHVHTRGAPALPHTHWHEHQPISHSHPHWPDIHHRHGHGS